ncbi:serine hydrolase domain-containing protein [Macellibacteroides fermentans]|uniref:CubicO group peptidase (Beta-lactamase class C family) n=1 Tax=Macellibacteroides fermentans TaxID=879969 RepID=A0A8E2A068_9PORP|nr:serine hydrolase [Macellibacteroides fermentans]NYI49120.1 CubicO group peptidase (beta-lactamase class C family) [Macellibacteroides fermentans]
MKKIIGALLLVCIFVGGYLLIPSNYYLRQTIVHLYPKIDQYPIFENRKVSAKDPQPWETADVYNKLSINPAYLPQFKKHGTVAFLVIQDSALVFEQYWEDYSDQKRSNSFSMAKSIVSLAIGCAIDDGFIANTEQAVSDFIPEFNSFNGKKLTIKHLLTMSAGVDFEESYVSPFSPTTQLYYGDNLKKATGESLSAYVSRRLWTPMHAEEDALWSLDHKGGSEKAYCCFNSNARDFARFGQLILNNGSWDGNQLVSASYIKEAITPDTLLIDKKYNEPNRHYGYQFWKLNFEGSEVVYMRGMLGQYVFVIPDKRAIVVRLGHKRGENYTSQHYPDDIDVWLKAASDLLNQKENKTF